MDAPDLDVRAHHLALRALGRANIVSRTVATLWPAILAIAARGRDAQAPAEPLRILELACGGGDVSIGLARRASRAGVSTDILACDRSPVALDYAKRAAAGAGVSGIRFEAIDALRDPMPAGFDVVLCSLFLHHLEDDDAVALLDRMRRAARQLVLVSDLRRTQLGSLFTLVGCRLLSRSAVFHVDGMRSVAAAFTSDEARALAVRAGLGGASLTDVWPQRFVISWSAQTGSTGGR